MEGSVRWEGILTLIIAAAIKTQTPTCRAAWRLAPGPCIDVSGTSGTLPEAPGTHPEPNQKTYEPKTNRLSNRIRIWLATPLGLAPFYRQPTRQPESDSDGAGTLWRGAGYRRAETSSTRWRGTAIDGQRPKLGPASVRLFTQATNRGYKGQGGGGDKGL